MADAPYHFRENNWSGILKDLEIFDTFFINDNVFSGFEASLDHKKKLHQFVMGEKGVELAKDITEIKNNIEREKINLKGYELELTKNINEFVIKDYLKLLPSNNIQSKIENKKKELELAKKQQEIKRIAKYQPIPKIKLPFSINDCRELLTTCIKDIDQKYIEEVQMRLQSLREAGINNPEEWIRDGFVSISNKEETCPFCSQSLTNVDELITSYSQFFNKEYKILKNKCEKILKEFNSYNLLLEIQKLKTIISNNQQLTVFWNPLVEQEVAVSLEFGADFSEIYSEVKNDVIQKVSHLLEEVNLDNINLLEEHLGIVNNLIDQLNIQLEASNDYIETLKNSSKNVDIIEKEMKMLQEEKRRFEEPILSCCNRYINTDGKIKQLVKQNKQKQTLLNQFSSDIFQSYGEKINHYLKEFSTQFEIKNIKSTIVGRSKEPSVSYVLTLNGCEFSFDNTDGTMQASKALSDGDRSTLALAFFLAKLDIEGNIEEKIIVFDDPLSSLDSNRRNKTVNLLLEKSQKAKQTFILSHNDSFVFKLYEKAAPKMLTVTYDGKLNDLDQSDMEDLIEHRYFTQIKKIESFCESPNLSASINELQGSIRIVLEDSIKFRYRKHLKSEYENEEGKKIGPLSNKEGLGSMINILEASNCIFKGEKSLVIAQLRELNDFANAPHHGNIEASHREERLTVDELVTYLRQALEVIYEKI